MSPVSAVMDGTPAGVVGLVLPRLEAEGPVIGFLEPAAVGGIQHVRRRWGSRDDRRHPEPAGAADEVGVPVPSAQVSSDATWGSPRPLARTREDTMTSLGGPARHGRTRSA
jgi:hypothetical protein